MSKTMPVPLLIIIAIKRGDQPSFNNGLTCSFLNVYIKQVNARQTTSAPTIKGIGVRMKGTRRVETVPKRTSVNKSPKQDAIAGAILSGSRLYFLHRTMTVHISEPRSKPERHAAVMVEQVTIIKLIVVL